mmetsp:Transcript_21637/g.55708  ORF Transcript_21637/g.55708 Transcript_21637/m.55708 type:complete len:201 (-) Transcript_21637:36-638(-)
MPLSAPPGLSAPLSTASAKRRADETASWSGVHMPRRNPAMGVRVMCASACVSSGLIAVPSTCRTSTAGACARSKPTPCASTPAQPVRVTVLSAAKLGEAARGTIPPHRSYNTLCTSWRTPWLSSARDVMLPSACATAAFVHARKRRLTEREEATDVRSPTVSTRRDRISTMMCSGSTSTSTTSAGEGALVIAGYELPRGV